MKLSFAAGARHKFDSTKIISIIADINYSYVYSTNGQCHLHSRTLKWFMDRCPALVRIHKHYVINTDYVKSYCIKRGRQPSGYVIMNNDLRLTISTRNLGQIGELLKQNTSLESL